MLNKNQKALLKAAYMEGECEKWADWYVKRTAEIICLPDGSFIPIEKETIKKDFCFGYSDTSDMSDFYAAGEAAYNARTNQDYFMKENMKKFRQMLEVIKEQNLDADMLPEYVIVLCNPHGEIDKIRSIDYVRDWSVLEGFGGSAYVHELPGKDFTYRGVKYHIPTTKELEMIKAGYSKAAEEHEKKVIRYLKRYGLEHVNSWSYWRDA